MSVCGQSGQAEEDSAAEEGMPTPPSATRDIYKQKPASKLVRVLTVLAYLLSVSLAAILLSVYYVCVWRSPELPRELRDNGTAYQRQQLFDHDQNSELTPPSTVTTYGGGDTTVSGDIIHTTPENITGGFSDDGVKEPSSDATPMATALPDITPDLNGTSGFSPNDTDSGT